MYYTAVAPTLRPDVGDDDRILAVDLKREPLLPLDTVKAALAKGDSPEALAGPRLVLLETITGDGDLARLLEVPELKLVRERLMELTSLPPSGEHDSKVIIYFPIGCTRYRLLTLIPSISSAKQTGEPAL
jgi:hypothetical protein